MKKLNEAYFFIMVLSMLLTFACVNTAYSQSPQTSNMTTSVSVNAVFGITVFPLSLDFPAVDPATTTAVRELTLWCSTNNNSAWSLQLFNLAELTAGAVTIPNSNFNWWGWSAGSGTWNAGTAKLSTAPFIFYGCGADEYITAAPVEIHLSFNIDIPQNQAAGSYTSTLVITMTE